MCVCACVCVCGRPHPYSPSDVAHVLCFTGNLANITDAEKDGWAARINSFQRDDGFYSNHDRNNVSGGYELLYVP